MINMTAVVCTAIIAGAALIAWIALLLTMRYIK